MSWFFSCGTGDQSDLSGGGLPGGTLTIAAGQTVGTISARLNADSSVEFDESLVLQLYNLSPAAVFEGQAQRLYAFGTVLDDDGAGEKRTLLVSGAELIEGTAGTQLATFRVQLSRPAAAELRLDYRTVDGSALAGQDYDAATGVLVFAPGQTEALVAVPVRGDTLAEAEESFTLLVAPQAPSAAQFAAGGTAIGGEGLIGDDDSGGGTTPVVSVRGVRQVEATTGSDPNYLNFEVVLSQPATGNVTMSWFVRAGTADQADTSSGSLPAGTLAITAGQTSGFVSVRINGDSAIETDQTLLLQLYNLSSGAVFERGAPRLYATGTILDDDGTGEKRMLSVVGAELVEGDTGTQLATFRVQLSRPATNELRLDYRTVDGSALAGQDYDAATGVLVFAAGQTEAVVSVLVRGDAQAEFEEQFTLLVTPQAASADLLAGGGAGVGAIGLIGDDDTGGGTRPVVSVRGARQYEATTGSDPNYLEFEVVLSEPTATNVSMDWFTSGGSADQGDLSAGAFPGGTLTLLAGQTSGFISVRLNGGSGAEPDESLLLHLHDLSSGAVFEGGAASLHATGIILDDDGTGEKRALLVSAAELVEDSDGQRLAAFKVQLSRPAVTELRLDYRTVDGSALAGQDYDAVAGALVFAPGQTEALVFVPVRGDTQVETEERFTLLVTPQAPSAPLLAAGAGGVGAVGIIRDDDFGDSARPVVTVRSARQFEATTGSDPNYLNFEVVLSHPATSNVSMNWYVSGGTANQGDLSSGSFPGGTLTLGAGQSSGFISVRVSGDGTGEADETLVLQLYGLSPGAVFEGSVPRLFAHGTILDDDGSGEKRTLLVSGAEVIEGGPGTRMATFKVQLSQPADSELRLDYRTVDGTALAGQDYDAATGTLVFAPGQTETVVWVPVRGDLQAEDEEHFTLLVAPQAPSSSALLATGGAGIGGLGLIGDDDSGGSRPVVAVRSVRQTEATTGSDPNYLHFEVVLSEPAATSVSMNWYVSGGTANQGDLSSGSFPGGTLTLSAGQSSGFISVRVSGDGTAEADETLVLQLYNLSSGAAFERGAARLYATGTILDDDGTGEKRLLSVAGAEMVEGDAGTQLATFRVQLSRPAATELRLDYRTLDGSALAGQDYDAATGVLVFAPGQTEAAVTVPVRGDTLAEAEESFALLVAPQAASAALLATGAAGVGATGLIGDDDTGGGTRPIVSVRGVRQHEATTGSDPNYLEFEVVLSEPASTNVSMSWYVSTGTVNQGDLSSGVFPSGTLTISAGQTSGFVSVRISGDGTAEADEVLVLQLYNLSSGAVFERDALRLHAIGTILDDDGTGANRALLISGVELLEGHASTQLATFKVQLSRPADTELRLDYRTVDGTALAGQDYDAATGELVFAPGQTEAFVSVAVRGDTRPEGEESFSLLVTPQASSAPQLAAGAAGVGATGLIGDDDSGSSALPVLSVRSVRQPEATTGSDPNYLQFEVVLSRPAASNVSLTWRTLAGSATAADLSSGTLPSGQLILSAGQTSAFINVRIAGDSQIESDEHLRLELSNPNGAVFAGGAARLHATGFILDDDSSGQKQVLAVGDALVTEGHEGTAQAVFSLSLSRPMSEPLVLSYRTVGASAQPGSDFQATSGTVVFAPGQAEATVNVPVFGDYLLEADETFSLQIDPSNLVANGSAGWNATGIIVSDDTQNPPVTVADSYTTTEGRGVSVPAATGVLANDTDPEGNTFVAQLVGDALHGTVTLGEDGSFTYVPDAGFHGLDSFTYRAFDGIGASDATRVEIAVTELPDGPEPHPVGPARVVNAFDEGDQITPSVAALSDGSFVVVWVSRGQDGDGDGVYGRIVDGKGEPVSAEFRINSTIAGDQQAPRVAALEGAGFVVVWDSFGQDGDKDAIVARRFGNDGLAAGAEVLVNQTTSSWQVAPDVTGTPGGGYAVVWQSEGQDGSGSGVFGRRFGANDAALGAEFRLSQETRLDQSYPRIAALAGGSLVTAWESEGQDGDGKGVFGRVFAGNGTALAGELQANAYTPSFQSRPDVSALADGGFVLTWQSYGQGSDRNSIHSRTFSANGTPSGSEHQVSLSARSNDDGSVVASLDDDTYVVGFQSDMRSSQGDAWTLARFEPNGTALGQPTIVAPVRAQSDSVAGSLAVAHSGSMLSVMEVIVNGETRIESMPLFAAPSSEPMLVQQPRIAGMLTTSNINLHPAGQSNAQSPNFSTGAVPLFDILGPSPIVIPTELDDRTRVSDFGKPVAAGAVRIEADFLVGAGGEASGSGIFVSPKHVLTAGHVIESNSIFTVIDDLLFDAEFEVIVDREDGQSPRRYEVESVELLRGRDTQNLEDDIALITLKEPVPEAANAPGLASFYDQEDLEGRRVSTVGYPYDGNKQAREASGTVNDVNVVDDPVFGKKTTGANFDAGVDAVNGQSGSGVVTEVDGNPATIGVISRVTPSRAGQEGSTFAVVLDPGTVEKIDSKVAEDLSAEEVSALPKNVVRGTGKGETILDTRRTDDIKASDGHDTVVVRAGSDTIDGGEGSDTVILVDEDGELASSDDYEINEDLTELTNKRTGEKISLTRTERVVFRDKTLTKTPDGVEESPTHPSEAAKAANAQFDGANRPIDPLILDLDRDGIELIHTEDSSARFDMDADGFAERTAWLAADDAFLIHDRNGDGIVNDISEFFGSAGIDGFAELKGYDTNRDGSIADDEPIWGDLKLWRDLDGDGSTDAGELSTLAAVGVSDISLRVTEVSYRIAGNLVPYISSFEDENGSGLAADAFFQIDQLDSAFNGRSMFAEAFTLDPETLLLPYLRGYGDVADLYIEMSIDPALKGLVTQFARLPVASHAGVRTLAEEIIYRWARVENVATDSRGPYVDGRKLAVLERFFGESFDVTTTSGRFISNDPTTAAMGQRLAQSWDLLFDGILNNLIVQSDFDGAFDSVIYDFASDAPLLVGGIAEALAALTALTPGDELEAIRFWSLFGPLLQKLGEQTDLPGRTIAEQLDTAVRAAGLPFSFTALIHAQFATGVDGAKLSGGSDVDLFVGTLADEAFFGGQGGDVYVIGTPDFGDDAIVEVTSRVDEGAPDVIVLPAGLARDGFMVQRSGSGFLLTVPATGATLTVSNTSVAGADGDFGVEIVRLHDGTELLVADLLGVFAVEAGANAVVAEGGVFQRDITITDPGEAPPEGWQYRLEWSDGLVESGTVPASSGRIPVARTFADGDATFALSVLVSGGTGATDSDRVVVTVRNVEPGAVTASASRVAEGAVYSLGVGAITDPGPDTRTAYAIAWGDGSTQTFSSSAWAAANGRFSHVYADGAAARNIIVSATDEDGTHRLGSSTLEVFDVAPTIALSGEGTATAGQPYVLVLGAVTDPGADTASSVVVHWGDGTTSSHPATGTASHHYASAGNHTIVVDVVDEEGTHEAAGSIDLTVGAALGTVVFDAGADAGLQEGQTFSRTIQFIDEQDGGVPGWTFAIDWDGDGAADETGSTTSRGLSLNHVFPDGDGRQVVTVRIEDGATEFATDTFSVDVRNVTPTISLDGGTSVRAGSPFTLNLASVADPGQDSVSSYIVRWGDGQQQVVTALGLVTHGYVGAGKFDVAVDVVDEDGVHLAAGRHAVEVLQAPAAVSIDAGVNASVAEGSLFTRTITFNDGEDNGTTGWRFDIDWNDDGAIDESGSTLTPSVTLNRRFADGDSQQTVRVSVTDAPGETASDTFGLSVLNVVPQASVRGAAAGTAGAPWTLNIGTITDPGSDIVYRYTVRWGDGSSQSFTADELAAANRSIPHVYAGAGQYTVSLDLVDEDGSFAGVASIGVGIDTPPPVEPLRIGYAPQRLTSGTQNAWQDAWSAPGLSITHKADAAQTSEPWTPVGLLNGSPLVLSGSDVYLGDLGVSGQSANTSAVRQELDGAEALRFTLPRAAVRATIDLSSLQTNDDALGFSEAGRVQAFDAAGVLVAERLFIASDASGAKRISIESEQVFASLVITAGAYNGSSFVAGAYASTGGGFGAAPFNSGGRLHGSEFLVDGLELVMPVTVGVQSAVDPAFAFTQTGD